MIYIMTLCKSLVYSSVLREECLKLINKILHKISGMKALYIPLFFLFVIRLRKIHGIGFTYYIWKSE